MFFDGCDLDDREVAGDLVEELDGDIAGVAVRAARARGEVEFLEERGCVREAVAQIGDGGADGDVLIEHERMLVGAAVCADPIVIGVAGGDDELLQRAVGVEREGMAVEERDRALAGIGVQLDVFEGEEFRELEVAVGDGLDEAIGGHGSP